MPTIGHDTTIAAFIATARKCRASCIFMMMMVWYNNKYCYFGGIGIERNQIMIRGSKKKKKVLE